MEWRPTISGYTTTKNCIDQKYPWQESIKSLMGFCDEVVVVDGGSSDGTWEKLTAWQENDSTKKLKVYQVARNWDDKRFAVFDGAQKALARSMSNAKQVKAAVPLNNGLPSVNTFKSGDAVSLFSTNHTTIAGACSNTLTTQADLNETSLEQSLIDIAAMTDERGLKIAARGVKMIVPSANQFNAERLLKSQGRTATADNDINAVNSMGMIPQGYRVNHFLNDSDSFYIITDVPNGMKHFERTPLTTSMEGDFDTGNVRYKARERYVFGCSDYRGIFGCEGV